MAHPSELGHRPQYSGQAQPLFYEGVLYYLTGANDVFAIDVETGKTLWKYEAHLEPSARESVLRLDGPRRRHSAKARCSSASSMRSSSRSIRTPARCCGPSRRKIR